MVILILAVFGTACTGGRKDAGRRVELAEDDGLLTPYNETLVVNVMRVNNTDIWFPEGESFNDNILTRFYKEKLNIEYNIKWLIERGQMSRQLDLAIAAGDLPDLFEVNVGQLYRLAAAGLIEPLTDYYDRYVTGEVKADYEYNNRTFLNMATINGELYGVPQPDDFSGRIPLMYIRQDWLDRLGLAAPTNVEEFLAVCHAFVHLDPDGNGQNDTWAMAIDNGLGASLDFIANVFEHYPYGWDEFDGKLAWTDIQPSLLEPLNLLREMYARGYIDPEFAVKDTARVAQDIAAGRVGILPGVFWNPMYQLQMSKTANPQAEWAVYPMLQNEQGEYYKPISSITNHRYLVVRKGFGNPEAAFKGQNLWRELWRGEYSDFFHMNNQQDYNMAQENFKLYQPFWYDPPLKNYEVNIPLRAAWAARDISLLTDQEAIKHFNNFVETVEGRARSLTGWSEMIIRLHSFEIIHRVYGGSDPSLYKFTRYAGPWSRVFAQRQPLVDQIRNEFIIRYIMDQDSDFDGYVVRWIQSGGQELTDEVNAWYEANN